MPQEKGNPPEKLELKTHHHQYHENQSIAPNKNDHHACAVASNKKQAKLRAHSNYVIEQKQNYNVQARNQVGRAESNCAGQKSDGQARNQVGRLEFNCASQNCSKQGRNQFVQGRNAVSGAESNCARPNCSRYAGIVGPNDLDKCGCGAAWPAGPLL